MSETIPEDILRAASAAIAGDEHNDHYATWGELQERIARAIMAERERCAAAIEEYAEELRSTGDAYSAGDVDIAAMNVRKP